jgi:hypothetical protein
MLTGGRPRHRGLTRPTCMGSTAGESHQLQGEAALSVPVCRCSPYHQSSNVSPRRAPRPRAAWPAAAAADLDRAASGGAAASERASESSASDTSVGVLTRRPPPLSLVVVAQMSGKGSAPKAAAAKKAAPVAKKAPVVVPESQLKKRKAVDALKAKQQAQKVRRHSRLTASECARELLLMGCCSLLN